MLKEIRIHGRGGQGVVVAAQLLAHAAFIEGKWVQAIPFFGPERRGAPVKAFVRICDKPILLRSQVYNPDYVMILDPKLHEVINVTEGLKKDGIIVINTVKGPEELKLWDWRVATVDATSIALELDLRMAGLLIVNTPMLGAFAGATGEVSLTSVVRAIKETWAGSLGERSAKAAELAYERLRAR